MPRIGIHTQKIPPITSVKDKRVNSAAGITFDPIEYKIKPKHTIVPCTANKPSFLLEEKKLKSFWVIIVAENMLQKIPATATVVNLGVYFRHLNDTEKTEKPSAATKQNIKPSIELNELLPSAIIIMPIEATNIATQTLIDIFSFKNRKPNNAVIKGIAARHNNVIAVVVLVIDQINVIIAVPRPIPPINPEIPILK